jgi:hypothetical protein
MSLIAQYYECSVGIYNNVDCCKKNKKKTFETVKGT